MRISAHIYGAKRSFHVIFSCLSRQIHSRPKGRVLATISNISHSLPKNQQETNHRILKSFYKISNSKITQKDYILNCSNWKLFRFQMQFILWYFWIHIQFTLKSKATKHMQTTWKPICYICLQSMHNHQKVIFN